MRKLSTPAMVIYVILALVVGSYLYYSQYYIPHKEAILINKGVRTLASIDEGISNKEDFLESFMDQRLNATTLLSILEANKKEVQPKLDSLREKAARHKSPLIEWDLDVFKRSLEEIDSAKINDPEVDGTKLQKYLTNWADSGQYAAKRRALRLLEDNLAEQEIVGERLSAIKAQKVIVSNHVKPMNIRPSDWKEPEPRVVFNSGQYAESPFLEIKHVQSKVNDSLTKVLKLQKEIADQIEEEQDIRELRRKEMQIASMLKEAQSAFWVMGSEKTAEQKEFREIVRPPSKSPVREAPSQRTVRVSDVEPVTVEERLLAKITLDTLLADVMENEIFQCLVLHSVDDAEVYYSSDSRLISPMKKFESGTGDTVATRFGVNIFETQVNSRPYVEFRRYVQPGDQTLYLSGFINKEDYNEYLREIDYFLLILVLLTTFTLIAAVPLIKVFVINEWERLRDRDVLFSALSLLTVVFLGSLIFSTVHHYTEVEHDLEEDLDTYSNRLKDNFVNEVSTLITHTENFDFAQSSHWNDHGKFLFHEFFRTENGIVENIILPYDENGCNWDTSRFIGKFFRNFIRLSNRDYIKKVKSDDGYLLVQPDRPETDPSPLYIESVFSYSRAQKEAVISFPKEDRINGISVDLKSLMWSIPPEGFGYALIDRDMNVLFSSKKAKNNFKNLRTDLVGMEFIAQSISYGQPMEGHFDFGRDKFLGHITPIDNILTKRGDSPAFFVLTFANHDLVEWHTGLTSLLSAMACFGILFASLLLLILQGLFYINQKESRFFRHSNFYDSIFPERQDGLTYLFLITISLLGVVIGIVLYRFGLSALIRYGIVQVLLFGLLRPLLLSYNDIPKGRLRRRGYFATIIVILLGVIFYLPGGSAAGVSGIWSDKLILLVYVSLALVSALFVHARMKKSKNRPFALKRSRIFHKLKFILQSNTVKNLYIFSMYAWILAILVFPFVLVSDKCEVIVANSFEALASTHINDQLEGANAKLLSSYRPYNAIDKKINQLRLGEEWESFMVDELHFGADINRKVVPHQYADFFQPIFDLFAARYSYDPLYVPAEGVGFFERKRILSEEAAETESYSSKSQSGLSISNLVFFLFSLLLLYGLVRLFLNRIVFNISEELQGGRIRHYSVIEGLKKYRAHRKRRETELNEKLPLRLFLVGIPRSQRTTVLRSLDLERADLGFIDFGRNTTFLDSDYNPANLPLELIHAKAIIVRFWFPETITPEYLDRLRKLTRYMEETDLFQKGSVILSDLTITQIEEKWYEMNSGSDHDAAAKEVMLYLKEWFRSYREFLLPLEKERFGDSEAINGQIGFDDAYDDYLNKSYYSPIYFSVWHSLSLKERFIVYDLAEDGLMNARDSFMLMKLKRKGILSYNRNTYRMELFHRSFKLFVKRGVSIKEIINIERFSKKNGSWGQIRLALLLLILAMLLFIYELMPNMFNALAGAIGVIAGFSGAVSQLSGKVSLPQFGKLFGGTKNASAET
jgi:hypothetical protein